MTGRKDDLGKVRYELIRPKAYELWARVLTYGADKYGDHNWELLDNAEGRYYGALIRHLEAWRRGQSLDEESGLPHLAHALTNIAILIELEELNK